MDLTAIFTLTLAIWTVVLGLGWLRLDDRISDLAITKANKYDSIPWYQVKNFGGMVRSAMAGHSHPVPTLNTFDPVFIRRVREIVADMDEDTRIADESAAAEAAADLAVADAIIETLG